MTQLVLSLFPGIGLLDRAFEEEGFTVVRGPDVLWGGDIRRFHPPAGKFDGVIGGPPCQAFSRLAYMVRQNGREPKFGNLIPEFERVVCRARPQWFLMENVPDAPSPKVAGYDYYSYMLNNRQCFADDGLPAETNRLRRWTWGWLGPGRPVLEIHVTLFENPVFAHAAIGGSNSGKRAIRTGANGKTNTTMPFNSKSKAIVAELIRKQSLPADFMEHSPFTVEAQCKMLGNGVPLPMGRAIARAVKEATECP
jgi:DNA (cytosine-5)-methyltransferase 1